MAQNKFSLLSDDMRMSSNWLSQMLVKKLLENVFKLVITDAGKEVARSKKVTDNAGKEFTLFLASKPVKGKPLDKTKMFGDQLPYLLKQEEMSVKCGKHTSTPKKVERMGPSQSANRIFGSGGPDTGAKVPGRRLVMLLPN